jgi:hypothetical protein
MLPRKGAFLHTLGHLQTVEPEAKLGAKPTFAVNAGSDLRVFAPAVPFTPFYMDSPYQSKGSGC